MKLLTNILKNLVPNGCQWKKYGNISTPFMYTVNISNQGHVFNADRVMEIFSRIIPYSYQIFIEGSKLTVRPEIFPVLEFLDGHKVLYHLQTDALWENPGIIIRRLRQLKYLSTLRIVFDSYCEQNQSSPTKEHLRMAVHSGINVSTVTYFIPSTITRLKEIVSHAKQLGARGMSFRRCADTEYIDRETLCSGYLDLQELYREGYPVMLEDCPPTGISCGLNPSCRGAFGSCFVDPWGNLKACHQSNMILGNLLESGIEHLWSNPDSRKGLSCNEDKSKSISTKERSHPDPYPTALDSSLYPMPLFWLRIEPSGAILVRGYDFVSVSKRGARIVTTIDGNHQLKSFKKHFGQEALDLIYALFRHQFVRFERNHE